jgi:cell wall-associated NlpC family hydrolase
MHSRAHLINSVIRRPVIGATAAISIVGLVIAAHGQADPQDDTMAKLNELSRQAEQTTEAMHSAQLSLNDKVAAQKAAEQKHDADQAALDAAQAQLATYQSSVDKFAAAMYMGGRTDGLSAIMTADSPQHLIDKMSVQSAMATEMATQMESFKALRDQSANAAEESARSAADARTAAEQAAAVKADLQGKQSRLQLQIAVVKSQYNMLTPAQRTALAAPGPVPGPAPDAVPDPAPDAVPAIPDALPNPDAPFVQAMPGGFALPDGSMPEGAPPPDAMLPGMPGGGEKATIVQAALSRVGSPYSWGAAGPNAFDCSGLVMWSFQQAGLGLPHSSQALAGGGQPVDLSDLQPGDVITYYSDASHTGLYVGDGMVVHASTYGQPVRVVPIAAAGPIHNARRY